MARKSKPPKHEQSEPIPVLEGEVVSDEGDEQEEETLDATAADLPVEVVDPDDGVEREGDAAESNERGLVRYDALSSYLKEISRHPHLTKEEERELALKYFTDKDREAAYKLVVSNLWLVVKIAREYERAAKNLLDLIQEGNIGLLEAVKNFDPYRGVRFPSYAVWWVKAYIIRYIIANWRMVKIGTTQAQRKLFFNLKKERGKLEREGFIPAPKLLAERLNVKEGEVVEMEQRLGNSEVSVDAPLLDDGSSSLHSVIPSESITAEEALARKQMQELIADSFKEFSKTLNPKEKVIFTERMLGEEKVTLQDISEQLSISRERVRQIENRLREKLRDFLAGRLGSEIQLGEGES